MKKINKKLSPITAVNVAFIVGTASILLIALLVASMLEFLFKKLDIISIIGIGTSGWYWVVIFTATSIVVGLSLSFILARIIFKPLNKIVDGMERLAEGDFSTRIELGKYEELKKIEKTFNTLATELEKTEILRSDFVNDFSHELKTPIVSINGLISLMKNENLTEEKRNQYLAVMEQEANRLTQMTSNALYLSKIETQSILTNKESYNISEQIRTCLLLLERKWTAKNLTPVLELDEYTVSANQDMMTQVWLNLLDNAIKFSETNKDLLICAKRNEKEISVSITNYGTEIKESEYNAIFNKFYQSDKSRSTEGNGIGLSIVKHIVNLHNGKITVESKNGKTAFTVTLAT
ncbi:MAG: HAMP domain-containing histidine kinase [Ruminococcaceae bacterium]|nr:HAMP domain-containing histidine kinase [Oscillospiraceae bacterium]